MQKYQTTPTILSLKESDNIFQFIKDYASLVRLKSAFFTGIGALNNITMSFYQREHQQHIHHVFQGTYEIASLSGNVTWSDDGWFVHIHAAISDDSFQVYGGHLSDAYASASTEIAITPLPEIITRTRHPELNIKVIGPFCLTQGMNHHE